MWRTKRVLPQPVGPFSSTGRRWRGGRLEERDLVAERPVVRAPRGRRLERAGAGAAARRSRMGADARAQRLGRGGARPGPPRRAGAHEVPRRRRATPRGEDDRRWPATSGSAPGSCAASPGSRSRGCARGRSGVMPAAASAIVMPNIPPTISQKAQRPRRVWRSASQRPGEGRQRVADHRELDHRVGAEEGHVPVHGGDVGAVGPLVHLRPGVREAEDAGADRREDRRADRPVQREPRSGCERPERRSDACRRRPPCRGRRGARAPRRRRRPRASRAASRSSSSGGRCRGCPRGR